MYYYFPFPWYERDYVIFKQPYLKSTAELIFHQSKSKVLKHIHENLIVAAHLRGMRPTPSTKKDTLMLREKL